MAYTRVLSVVLAAASACALENPLTGARQLGMGASGIAVTEDSTVPWWNPAALGWDSGAAAGAQGGFSQGSPGSIGVQANAGFHAYGQFIENADQLVEYANQLRIVNQTGLTSADQLKQGLGVVKTLLSFSDPVNCLGSSANVAGAVRIGRFALGARVGGESFAWAGNIDVRNIVPAVDGADLADQINASGQTFDGTYQVLNAQQQQSIYESLGGTGTVGDDADATDATQRIDDALRNAGAAAPVAAQAATWLAAAASGAGNLDQNTTSVLVRSFGYIEVPLSVGVPIDEHISVGGSLKMIAGRVYGTRLLVFQEDVDEAVAELKGEHRDSVNLGVDLGVQVKAGNWRMAATGRNLNSPTFAGPDQADGAVRDVRLDPQVTFGLGWRPADWFTLAADIEQFEVATINPDVHTRRIGGGLEFAAIPLLALRAGVYANLADQDAPPVLTAGAGIGPSWLHLDAAVACASEMEDFGQWQLPSELRASIGLTGNW